MSNINFLKPDRTNLNTFLYLGSFLFFISILDVFLNSFFYVLLIRIETILASKRLEALHRQFGKRAQ